VHKKRGVGEKMNSVSVLQSKKQLVDVTGLEPRAWLRRGAILPLSLVAIFPLSKPFQKNLLGVTQTVRTGYLASELGLNYFVPATGGA
jgi:hypothetical protein